MSEMPSTGTIPALDLPARLMLARHHANLKQSELATRIGTSRATIANYEGGSTPRKSTVLAWALACGVSPQWLVDGKTPSPDGDGAGVVRPKGFEPLTFCLASRRLSTSPNVDSAPATVSDYRQPA